MAYEAVELGEVGNVERLLEAGADPQAIPDTKVLLPLEMAAQVGIAQVAKSLIKHGGRRPAARCMPLMRRDCSTRRESCRTAA